MQLSADTEIERALHYLYAKYFVCKLLREGKQLGIERALEIVAEADNLTGIQELTHTEAVSLESRGILTATNQMEPAILSATTKNAGSQVKKTTAGPYVGENTSVVVTAPVQSTGSGVSAAEESIGFVKRIWGWVRTLF